MFIEIVDIGSGNIKSIQNSIERLNIPTKIVYKPSEIQSNFLLLPGVGSVGSYMDRLKKSEFDKAIKDYVNNGNRLLGICLGFQIMGNYSSEDGGVEGLDLINGYTERLEGNISHNSWEPFSLNRNNLNGHSLNSKLKLTRKQNINGRVFYNHEYGFINNEEKSYDIKISDRLNKYSSFIIKNNIIGIQFHPEKSQQTGLDLMSIIL